MMEQSVASVTKDPFHFFQSSNLHFGIVKSVDDPALRGRVLVECPAVFDEGPENWSGWADFYGQPTGCQSFKGDMGIWWPPVPGLLVSLGFEGGSPKKPFCFPAGAWADNGTPYLPLDARVQGKKSIHVRALKSEAGHTLLFDDNGQQEAMFLVDWTGAGWFAMCPGTQADEKSSANCVASRMRKGKMRGGASTMNQKSPGVGDISASGMAFMGSLDLNGSGVIQWSLDGDEAVYVFAKTSMDADPTASIVLDPKTPQVIITAGDTQLRVDGPSGHTYTTSHIIWNSPIKDVVTSIKKAIGAIKDCYSKYLES